jgi:hypothetical protein
LLAVTQWTFKWGKELLWLRYKTPIWRVSCGAPSPSKKGVGQTYFNEYPQYQNHDFFQTS